MCDPVSMVVGAVGGMAVSKAMTPKAPKISQPDPAAERAQAEAEAQQRANAQLAADQRRRREQMGLLARGAPAQPTVSFGDSQRTGGPEGVFGAAAQAVTRSATARQASMLSRGASITLGGGGSSGRQVNVL